jgi:hypothetical protein
MARVTALTQRACAKRDTGLIGANKALTCSAASSPGRRATLGQGFDMTLAPFYLETQAPFWSLTL